MIQLTPIRPNFTQVQLGEMTLWFSYQTLVAFQHSGTSIVCIENLWGPTTGKHLNQIQPNKSQRYGKEAFEQMLKVHGLS